MEIPITILAVALLLHIITLYLTYRTSKIQKQCETGIRFSVSHNEVIMYVDGRKVAECRYLYRNDIPTVKTFLQKEYESNIALYEKTREKTKPYHYEWPKDA